MFDSLQGSTLEVEIAPAAAGFLAEAADNRSSAMGMRAPRRLQIVRRASFGDPSRYSSLGTTGIDQLPPYDVLGDEAQLLDWIAERKMAGMLDIIARELGRRFGAVRPMARLVEDVETEDKVVVLVARAALAADEAIEVLLEFTGTDWWTRMVTATRGGIVVDVECA